MKRRRVEIDSAARADLRDIFDAIRPHSGTETARRFVHDIFAFCKGLEIGSERGSVRASVRPGLRAIGFRKRVTVVFAVDGDVVKVARIFYGGQDWERRF